MKINASVTIEEEHALAIRIPLRDVVRDFRHNASSVSRHIEKVRELRRNSQRDT